MIEINFMPLHIRRTESNKDMRTFQISYHGFELSAALHPIRPSLAYDGGSARDDFDKITVVSNDHLFQRGNIYHFLPTSTREPIARLSNVLKAQYRN